MRRLSADYIFINKYKFLPKGIINIDDAGVIHSIEDTAGKLSETANLEYYNGILVPGFVNTHCHLELSYLKGVINKNKGLHGFIKEIMIAKKTIPDNLHDLLERADAEMRAEGIVAVGDISNTDTTFNLKRQSSIYYHSFLELYNSGQKPVNEIITKGLKLKKSLGSLSGNFVPHAPYSVAPKLFTAINKLNSTNPKSIISIHNQETEAENKLFKTQSGLLYDTFVKIGFDFSTFNFENKSSLRSVMKQLPKDKNILFIHNTFTQENDIDFAENYSNSIYFTFCPASNLYIEGCLPDIPLFFDKNVKICIGTDSYASNTRLSILHELKIIHKNFPKIPLGELLEAASLNGAKALNINHIYGSIETGKNPGINLLTNIDYENMHITSESNVINLTPRIP
ncbi:MAG: amidohydrolase [Candidatus Delongbacteria bacterium]|nr:MAG: amidohydrolase [Candidatus Delongbacteria bacterium]